MHIRWIKGAEWLTAILLSLAVLFLLIVRVTHAGGLWRDECGVVQLAAMPSVSDILKNFEHQTLPLLFPLAIRFYMALFGGSDTSLKGIPLLMGLALVGAAWFNARGLERGVPLMVLALLGLNTTFLYWNGYGLTGVVLVPALGLTAILLLRPSPAGIIAALLACLLSVQLLINNLVLVLVIVLSAAIACLVRGFAKLGLTMAGIGLCCAASALLYLGTYSAADWKIVLKAPAHLLSRWEPFNSALGNPASIMPSVWYVIFLAAIIGAGYELILIWNREDRHRSAVLIFAVLVGVLAPLAYFGTFRLSGYRSHPRHFVSLIALLAANIDLMVAQLSRNQWVRLARLLFVIAALVLFPIAVWPKILERQTNIDLVAQKLQENASPNDLIVVNPFFLGVSFYRYYHGQTPWVTVPVISEHRIHRWDLVKAKMMMPFPLGDLEQKMGATLRSRNRIWFVGRVKILRAGETPLSPLPAPDPEYGWQAFIYRSAWSEQVGDFVRRHAVRTDIVLPPMPAVNDLEDIPLWTAEGWQD